MKAMMDTGQLLALPGTIQGRTGWYESDTEALHFEVTGTHTTTSSVATEVGAAGDTITTTTGGGESGGGVEWNLVGRKSKKKWWSERVQTMKAKATVNRMIRRATRREARKQKKQHEHRLSQEEKKGEEEEGEEEKEDEEEEKVEEKDEGSDDDDEDEDYDHGEETCSVTAGVIRAITKLQANYRRMRDRALVSDHTAQMGWMLALPGTIQGRSGWYQSGKEAKLYIVRFTDPVTGNELPPGTDSTTLAKIGAEEEWHLQRTAALADWMQMGKTLKTNKRNSTMDF
jgi:hypothetical protein